MTTNTTAPHLRLILASSSPYRKQQLQQLRLNFDTDAPNIDESALTDEPAETLASRLSLEKAKSLEHKHPNSIIIAGDQTAAFKGKIFGKPGTKENAIAQLHAFQSNSVMFYSGVSVLNTSLQRYLRQTIATRVTFRPLTTAQIERYIEIEAPLDCAGSFKCEGLGVSLFSAVESLDPNALMGLPLISLNMMLADMGIDTLGA